MALARKAALLGTEGTPELTIPYVYVSTPP